MSKYDVILDVYENQSISKAAQKHNYTQSAVSQTIRNYEKEIGLKLFKRSKTEWKHFPEQNPSLKNLCISAPPIHGSIRSSQISTIWTVVLSASERCRALPITGSPEYMKIFCRIPEYHLSALC